MAICRTFKVLGVSLCFLAFNGLFFALFFSSCSEINKKMGVQDDNFVEEVAEALLENKTGIDVDFTPETEE